MNNELTDTDLMPFGLHKGIPMQDVPVKYLHWAYCNMTAVSGKDSERVINYIKRSLNVLKMEDRDLIWNRTV